MISKWLFSGALVLEAGSWGSLWLDAPVSHQLLVFIFSHALACLMLCGAVWLLLPARYRAPLPWSPIFIFSLAFFVPVIGALGVVASIFPALYLPRKRDRQAWQSVGIPGLPFRAHAQTRSPIFADGGLQDVLRHAPDPDQRLAALLATRRMPGKDAVPILKLALGDPSDDVRLLAYSMLDKQESDSPWRPPDGTAGNLRQPETCLRSDPSPFRDPDRRRLPEADDAAPGRCRLQA